VTWLAWALCILSVTLAVASVALATFNGESPVELVASHHAIGILDALVLPRRSRPGCGSKPACMPWPRSC
jgi:hypothetical protein